MTQELFSWGSGSYGRLGLGGSQDHEIPQRVGGICNGRSFQSLSCGWYHSAAVSDTGEVLTFGSNVTGCLGMGDANADQFSDSSSDENEEDLLDDDPEISELVQAQVGGQGQGEGSNSASSTADFGDAATVKADEADAEALAELKRRRRLKEVRQRQRANRLNERSTETYVPQLVPFKNKKIVVVQVSCGGDMIGAHTLALTKHGRVYAWGYGPACGLGTSNEVLAPQNVSKYYGYPATSANYMLGHTSNGVDEMEGHGWGNRSNRSKRWLTKVQGTGARTGLQTLNPRIVKVAAGGSFSIALSYEGHVYTWGLSASGRLGFRTRFRAQLRPRRLEHMRLSQNVGVYGARIDDIAAGASFGLLLCGQSGDNSLGSRLYSFGENGKGQLGLGHLMDQYEPSLVMLPGGFSGGGGGNSPRDGMSGLNNSVGGPNLVAVAAGDSHSLALDTNGIVYTWGGLGGSCLGHGSPNPTGLIGKVPPAFSNKKIDRERYRLYLAELEKERLASEGLKPGEGPGVMDPFVTGGMGGIGGVDEIDGRDNFDQMVSLAVQFRLRSVPFTWTRPRAVRSLSNVVRVSAGFAHSSALCSDGTLYSWGSITMPGGALKKRQAGGGGNTGERFSFAKAIKGKKMLHGYGYLNELDESYMEVESEDDENGKGNGENGKGNSAGSSSSSTGGPSAGGVGGDAGAAKKGKNSKFGMKIRNAFAPATQENVQWTPRLVSGTPETPLLVADDSDSGGWHNICTGRYELPYLQNLAMSGEQIYNNSSGIGQGYSSSSTSQPASSPYQSSPQYSGFGNIDDQFLRFYLKCRGANVPVCAPVLKARLASAGRGAWHWIADQMLSKRDLEEAEEETLCDIFLTEGRGKRLREKVEPVAFNMGTPRAGPKGPKGGILFTSSSESHESSDDNLPRSSTAQRVLKKRRQAQNNKSSSQHSSHQKSTSGVGTTGVQTISSLSEAIVTAFLKFIYVDAVYFQIIDEEHDLYQQELAHGPDGQRASQGLLTHSEVEQLRALGQVLGLDRLVRLVDSVLDEGDRMGSDRGSLMSELGMRAPPRHVPSGDLRDAVLRLFQQTFDRSQLQNYVQWHKTKFNKGFRDQNGNINGNTAPSVAGKNLWMIEQNNLFNDPSSSVNFGNNVDCLLACQPPAYCPEKYWHGRIVVDGRGMGKDGGGKDGGKTDGYYLGAHAFVILGECSEAHLIEAKPSTNNNDSRGVGGGDIRPTSPLLDGGVGGVASSSLQQSPYTPGTKSDSSEGTIGIGGQRSASDDRSMNDTMEKFWLLDCSQFPVDIVLAGLAFLYTQDVAPVQMPLVRPPIKEGEEDLLETFFFQSEELWQSLEHISAAGAGSGNVSKEKGGVGGMGSGIVPPRAPASGASAASSAASSAVGGMVSSIPISEDQKKGNSSASISTRADYDSSTLASQEENEILRSKVSGGGRGSGSMTGGGPSSGSMTDAAALSEAQGVLECFRTKFIWPKKRRILWFMDLLRFACKLRARKLQIYCEDALIGFISDNSWADILVCADELGAWNLRVAALQFGVRQIAPFVFLRFFGKHRTAGVNKGGETSTSGTSGAEEKSEGGNAGAKGKNNKDSNKENNKENAPLQTESQKFQSAVSTTEARLNRKDRKPLGINTNLSNLSTNGMSNGTATGTGHPSSPTKLNSPKNSATQFKQKAEQSEGLLSGNLGNLGSGISLQSDVFKAKELEAFLFDLDIPHSNMVLTEYFNSNVLKELKQRRPGTFSELKDKLVNCLVEFQKVEHNIDLILKKSVFETEDSQLTNLMDQARKGFGSFFFVRSDRVAERAPEGAPPHIRRQYAGKEKFLLGWLLIKYFWELILLVTAMFIWRRIFREMFLGWMSTSNSYRFELQDRILLLYGLNSMTGFITTHAFAPLEVLDENGQLNTAFLSEYGPVASTIHAFDVMVRSSDLPGWVLTTYDFFVWCLKGIRVASQWFQINPYFLVMAGNCFLLVGFFYLYVKYL